MNNLEYLNMISQSNRPVEPAKKASSINFSLILKILLSGLVLTVILIAIGLLINSGGNRALNLTQQLYSRINNVNGVLKEFNPKLKSSRLRSIGYSLSSTLTNTGSQLSEYITSAYPDIEAPLVPDEETLLSENTMFNAPGGIMEQLSTAQLNARLDQHYATQIQLQVSLLMAMSSELMERDDDPKLLQILSNFYSSLNAIDKGFDEYFAIN